MICACPRLALAAERGGAGKTTLAVGLLAAWRRRGRRVLAFKKGPDYIDSAWLAAASGKPCRNLDAFLMGEETARRSFLKHALADGVNLVEGNRGLFDGMDPEGSFSTAELAKQLGCPVVMVLDCTKRTRTTAAVALGCKLLDEKVNLVGVILNRLGTSRQERVTRAAVEGQTGLRVFGAVPRLANPFFRERRLGLVPPQEIGSPDEAVESMAKVVESHVDVEGLWEVAHQVPALDLLDESENDVETLRVDAGRPERPRIAYFFDAAFHFYYPENLEALEKNGAELVRVDCIQDPGLPGDIDGLYIGGGFPEESAPALAANPDMRRSVREAAERGVPIYAECGGLMYLGRQIEIGGAAHPMAGVFPVSFVMEQKPQGHGYVEAVANGRHPFFPAGAVVRGHEFHYSRPVGWKESELTFGLSLRRGQGFCDGRDGLVYRDTFATFVHTHALGEPLWAGALVEKSRLFSRRKHAGAGIKAEP